MWAPKGWASHGAITKLKSSDRTTLCFTPNREPAPPAATGGDFAELLASLERLQTPYIAVTIHASGAVSFALDRSGQENLFYLASETSLLIATERWSLAFAGGGSAESNAAQIRGLSPQHIASWRPGHPRVTTHERERHGPVRDFAAGALGRRIRQLASAAAQTAAQRHYRAVVLLSGGLDSAVVASLAVSAFRAVSLLHARHPFRERDWETVNARQVARSLARDLHELQLRPEQLLRETELAFDLGRHGWLGWALRIQDAAARIGDCAVSGGAVEFFGRDALWRSPSAAAKLLEHPRGPDILNVFSVRRFAGSLRRRDKDEAPGAGYCNTVGGHRYLLANTLLQRGLETVCPFAVGDLLEQAEALVGSGFRVEKALIRAEFALNLPHLVVTTPRRGTAPFPREWYGSFAKSEDVATAIRRVSTRATLARISHTISGQDPRPSFPSLSRSLPGLPETAVTPKVMR